LYGVLFFSFVTAEKLSATGKILDILPRCAMMKKESGDGE